MVRNTSEKDLADSGERSLQMHHQTLRSQKMGVILKGEVNKLSCRIFRKGRHKEVKCGPREGTDINTIHPRRATKDGFRGVDSRDFD